MRQTRKTPENTLNIDNITIPEKVLFHPELTARERVLYGMLDQLARRSTDGYVYASNIDLGKIIGLDPQNASNGIANLRKLKLIIVEYGSPDKYGDFRYEPYEGGPYHASRARRIKPIAEN